MSSPSTRPIPMTVLAVSIIALSACATFQVDSYSAAGLDVRQYRTYSWGPPDGTATGDPRVDNNQIFEDRLRGRVDQELARRGFEKTTSESPDLFVHYHTSFTQEIDVQELDRDYSYCERSDCGPSVFDAGTLFVDLVDPRASRLVWRGWAESSMDGVIDNQQLMETRIDRAVSKILQRLPRRL